MKVTESFIREEKGIMSRVYIDPKTIGKMERNNRSMRSSSRYLIKQKKNRILEMADLRVIYTKNLLEICQCE